MKDWETTATVLKEKDKFEAMCNESLPDLSLLRQVYEVNAAGGFHESIAKKLRIAASWVSRNLSDVQAQLNSMRRDLERGFDRVDKRIDT